MVAVAGYSMKRTLAPAKHGKPLAPAPPELAQPAIQDAGQCSAVTFYHLVG